MTELQFVFLAFLLMGSKVNSLPREFRTLYEKYGLNQIVTYDQFLVLRKTLRKPPQYRALAQTNNVSAIQQLLVKYLKR